MQSGRGICLFRAPRSVATIADAVAEHLLVESMEPHWSGPVRPGAGGHEDEEALYAIIFTLDKVRSAYLCREKAPDTFGEVKFKHLVRLRLENKHPARVYSAARKKPIMP